MRNLDSSSRKEKKTAEGLESQPRKGGEGGETEVKCRREMVTPKWNY